MENDNMFPGITRHITDVVYHVSSLERDMSNLTFENAMKYISDALEFLTSHGDDRKTTSDTSSYTYSDIKKNTGKVLQMIQERQASQEPVPTDLIYAGNIVDNIVRHLDLVETIQEAYDGIHGDIDNVQKYIDGEKNPHNAKVRKETLYFLQHVRQCFLWWINL